LISPFQQFSFAIFNAGAVSLMFASTHNPPRSRFSSRTHSGTGSIFFDCFKLRRLLPAAAIATVMSATFNVAHAQGSWSTSHLSVARFGLAAASAGNVAVFAGGTTPQSSMLMSNAVDLYNSETGTWSTASLSVARAYLAAVSAGNMAMFAGGLLAAGALFDNSCRRSMVFKIVLFASCRMLNHARIAVDSLDMNLSLHLIARYLMRIFAGVGSSAVDIFDSVTGLWSTSVLSLPRFHLAAASVGNLAIFAGGQDKNLGIMLLKGRA
jgi:hypothetical protein